MLSVNKKEYVWVEKYRPKNVDDIILPETTKKGIRNWIKDGETPHLLLSGKTPGCLRPGTSIKVLQIPKWTDSRDIKKSYDLTQKELSILYSAPGVKYKRDAEIKNKIYFDENSIFNNTIKYCKLSSTNREIVNNDKNFTSRYLWVEHWAKKMEYIDAIKKTKHLRRYQRFFSEGLKGYTNDARLKVMFNLVTDNENRLLIESNTNETKAKG